MERRQKIGNTALEVFPVILGTVKAGKELDQKAMNAMIDRYLDLGGNALDTARVYTEGRSEEVLGNWLRQSGRRDSVVIITKGGHPRLETMHTPRMRESDMRADLEESLRSLKTDYIDLYFFHRDNPDQPVAESLEIMEKFVAEGKIRSYGCSNWSAARIREALDYSASHGLQGFAANQMLYNAGSAFMTPFPDDTMCAMDPEMEQLHRDAPILSIPYFGVCSGFFHALKAKGVEAVRQSPYCTEKNLALAERIFALAEEHNTSITAVLLGFYFTQDFPNCPLYGPSRIGQLDDLEGLLELSLHSSDFCL